MDPWAPSHAPSVGAKAGSDLWGSVALPNKPVSVTGKVPSCSFLGKSVLLQIMSEHVLPVLLPWEMITRGDASSVQVTIFLRDLGNRGTGMNEWPVL